MDAVALIPAYEPDSRLPAFADKLAQEGFKRVVVVDDGSGERYRGVFDALAEKPFCVVLRHERNRGKGAALKTGFGFILDRCPETHVVVTADSDGQHAPEDCRRVAEAVRNDDSVVALGCRSFRLKAVPFRSWIGNRWSSATFGLMYGLWLPDTQTGLRAFPRNMLQMLIDVRGDRFEYEIGVLIAVARRGVRVATVQIRTIYENGNAGTHFSPLKDAFRINWRVLSDFFRLDLFKT